MGRRFESRERELSTESSNSIVNVQKGLRPVALQKQVAEAQRRRTSSENVADLTEFMNDMFFGTVDKDKKVYDLTGGQGVGDASFNDEDSDDNASIRSGNSSVNNNKTQEWLEEARRIVASSPSRCDSPSRLVGSPRYAAAQGGPSPSLLDRRDPLSRSARRHRAVDSFSGEILSKTARHNRNSSGLSDSSSQPQSPAAASDSSPASAVQKWFANILRPNNNGNGNSSSNVAPFSNSPTNTNTLSHQHALDPAQFIPPRPSVHRRSRFQNDPAAGLPPDIPVPARRSFRTSLPDSQSKNPVEPGQRRFSISSENPVLSPPRKLVESAHRRSISSSTCSIEKIASRSEMNGLYKEGDGNQDSTGLNGFLKRQRILLGKVLDGELNLKAKVILSGRSNSTSTMVAAICYAWLMDNRKRNSDQESNSIVVPVMNVKREKMWKLRQAAWLFYHIHLDASSLLFADEVEFEDLMMVGKLSTLVVGEDILKNTSEVGSQCTILTDHFCEDAYDLLQSPALKKLLLSGILLDTQNLNANATTATSMTRDAEAVQLLLVGSSPSYRNTLFDQLMQDQKDIAFLETLAKNYGMPSMDSGHFVYDHMTDGGDGRVRMENKVSERKPTSASHHETQNSRMGSADNGSANTNRTQTKSGKTLLPPAQRTSAPKAQSPAEGAPRAKNKFSLAKWFGFGSK